MSTLMVSNIFSANSNRDQIEEEIDRVHIELDCSQHELIMLVALDQRIRVIDNEGTEDDATHNTVYHMAEFTKRVKNLQQTRYDHQYMNPTNS